MTEIDFTREFDYRRAVEGFKTSDDYGPLHIVIADGNVEDEWLESCKQSDPVFDRETNKEEIEFLDLLKSLPYSMRYAAYLEA